jgi:hypothetical protein
VTTTETRVGHEWRLVAPWWFWPQLGGAPSPGPADDRRQVRVTVPQLQKYDDPNLVNAFLAAPQQRLAFTPTGDRVATVETLVGRFPTSVTYGPRKLYLASHGRHYLVVCALHCDVAGFPHARREDVCETGFVVRRRTADVPGGPHGPVAAALRRWAVARRKLKVTERRLRAATGLRRLALARRKEVLVAAEATTREAARALAATVVEPGSTRRLQGWVPAGADAAGKPVDLPPCTGSGGPVPLSGVGAWRDVEEQPVELAEAAYPLTALVPDPTRPDHDAAGETIFFGVVPTGSADVDHGGAARFDDEKVYEIRCFARRHRPECPRDGRHCTCPITWSEPTEPYRLADHFDLEGCGNRPVTVQLPDLRRLQADALRLGPGGAGGVRFSSPPKSELSFTSDKVDAAASPGAMKNDGFQICSFAIPLITIVAFFVLRLFLPIVVLLFGLWFLLMLRFCIPPDVDISAEAALLADFTNLKVGLEADAGVAVEIAGRPTFRARLKELLDGSTLQNKKPSPTTDALVKAYEKSELDARSFASIGRGALTQGAAPAPARRFEPRVERDAVVTP